MLQSLFTIPQASASRVIRENRELESARSRSGRAEHGVDVARGQRPVRSDSYNDLDDEDKLVRLAGTIAAAEAERAALERRIAQRAIVRKLEKQLTEQAEATRRAQHWAQDLEHAKNESIRARQEDEMRFQHTVSALQAETTRLTDALSNKENEAEAREEEILHLHEDAVTLREENQSLRGENQSLRRQLSAQSTIIARNQDLRQENRSLQDEVNSKDAKIRELENEVHRLERTEQQVQAAARAQRAAAIPRAIAVASGMYGPVGRPHGGFHDPGFNGFHPPTQFPMGPPMCAPMGPPPSAPMGGPPSAPMGAPPSASMMFNTGPMPVMPSMGFPQGPPPPTQDHPYLPGSLSSVPSHQPSSEGGARSEMSGQVPVSPGAVSISPRHMMQDEGLISVDHSEHAAKEAPTIAPLPPSNEPIQTVPEPVQQVPEGSLPEPVQQLPVDGQAFLAKLQRKGSDFEGRHMRPLEANGVPAVHESTGLATQAPPPPPVQNSRSAPVVDEAPEPYEDRDEGQNDVVQPITQAVSSSVPSAAEEPAQVAPIRPAEPIYIPAISQGYLESLPQHQQQQYRDDVNALFNPPPQNAGDASDLAGQYVPAMPSGYTNRQVSSSQPDGAGSAPKQRNPQNKNKKKKGRGVQNKGQQGGQGSDRNGSSQGVGVDTVDQSAQSQSNEALRQNGRGKRKGGRGNRQNGPARNAQQA